MREGRCRASGAHGQHGDRGSRRVRRRRRGRIVGTDSEDAGVTVILVRVPYAEVVTYTKVLRSISRGAGSYSISVDGYEEVPAQVAQKIIAQYQAEKENA